MGNSPSNNFDRIDFEQLELLNAEKYFGLVNFGNTCYCNSVLQALYFCKPFREKILLYKLLHKKTKDTLLASLADLFYTIASQKKCVGSIAPKKFITRLRKEYENFNNYMQQDAHEFLNYLLNDISEILTAEYRQNYVATSNVTTDDDPSSSNHVTCSKHRRINGAAVVARDHDHVTSDRPEAVINGELPDDARTTEHNVAVATRLHRRKGVGTRRDKLLLWMWAKDKATASFRRRASHSGLPGSTSPTAATVAKDTEVGQQPRKTAPRSARITRWAALVHGRNGKSSTQKSSSAPTQCPITTATDSSKLSAALEMGADDEPDNFVNEIFRGTLTHETRCLNCESVSSTVEVFYDISVDVGPNTSITHCLRSYSNIQTLMAENKYECKMCNCKQEAQRRTSIKKLPPVLALHLKRFKMDPLGQPNKFTKVSYKVIFPLEIRLPVSLTDNEEPSTIYELVSIIVHCGTGLNRGHYISIVKSLGNWLLFDDDVVESIEESAIQEYFGISSDNQKSSDTAYILFYQAVDWRSF